jgi:hypothetical protein
LVSLTWKVDDKYKDNVVAGRSKRRMLEETRIWGDSLKGGCWTDLTGHGRGGLVQGGLVVHGD